MATIKQRIDNVTEDVTQGKTQIANPNGKLEFSTNSYYTSIINVENKKEINLIMYYATPLDVRVNDGYALPDGYYYSASPQIGSLTEEDAKVIGTLTINNCPNPSTPFKLNFYGDNCDTMSLVKSDFFDIDDGGYLGGNLVISNTRYYGADYNVEKIGFLLLKAIFYDCDSSPEYYFKVKIILKPTVGAPIIDHDSYKYTGSYPNEYVTFTVISPTFDEMRYWVGKVDDYGNVYEPDYTTVGQIVTNNKIETDVPSASGFPIGIMALRNGLLSPLTHTQVFD